MHSRWVDGKTTHVGVVQFGHCAQSEFSSASSAEGRICNSGQGLKVGASFPERRGTQIVIDNGNYEGL